MEFANDKHSCLATMNVYLYGLFHIEIYWTKNPHLTKDEGFKFINSFELIYNYFSNNRGIIDKVYFNHINSFLHIGGFNLHIPSVIRISFLINQLSY